MSDDSAMLDAPQPSDAAPDDQPHGAESNNTEVITRRVLLHEALFEEYETHTPFDESDETSVAAILEAIALELRTPDLKNVTQPALKKSDVNALRSGGGSATQGAGKSEDERNAERVSGFFALMAKAQKEEALRLDNLLSTHRARLNAIFERGLPEGWDHAPDEEEMHRLAETLTAHEIYGFIDDLREQHRKATARVEGDESRADEIERRVLESWLASVGAADAASGNGRRASRARGERRTADVVAESTDLMEALSHDAGVATEDASRSDTSAADGGDKDDDDLLKGEA
jgi:hypothetical protein